MPLVRIQVREVRSASEKKALLETVRSALVETLAVPEHDHTRRLYEYAIGCFEIPLDKAGMFTLDWEIRGGLPASDADLRFEAA